MNLFACPVCRTPLYFDNLTCGCGHAAWYAPESDTFLRDAQDCANRSEIGCNWAGSDPATLCASCAMTETRPDRGIGENAALWASAEAAKRWVLVSLFRWGWLADGDPNPRPTFDILTEETGQGPAHPIMGHAEGHIIINAAEADPVEIVRRRAQMSEPYRTMIGHFRHELAHYLWTCLARQEGFVDRFRSLFGDESADYGVALERYYADGPAPDWARHYISAYASSHPHEDWAETAAHVLHLSDLLHSARATAVSVGAWNTATTDIAAGLDLGLALNHLNRSMGLDDPYPFVVSEGTREKLTFAWNVLEAGPS